MSSIGQPPAFPAMRFLPPFEQLPPFAPAGLTPYAPMSIPESLCLAVIVGLDRIAKRVIYPIPDAYAKPANVREGDLASLKERAQILQNQIGGSEEGIVQRIVKAVNQHIGVYSGREVGHRNSASPALEHHFNRDGLVLDRSGLEKYIEQTDSTPLEIPIYRTEGGHYLAFEKVWPHYPQSTQVRSSMWLEEGVSDSEPQV